jgi:serine/threonine-protein kinase RsbW
VVDVPPVTDSRDVSLTIPARADYLVLARLALSAVCRLTPLSPEEVADLKLAITEAANDYVDEARGLDDESRLNFAFRLADDRLLMDLDGTSGPVQGSEQELSRAIIEATVDEAEFAGGRTRLTKYLNETG